MASKRCLPTRFFKDPDIMNLESRDAQLILVGLVLMADDEGRELAHAKLLSRELDYPPEQIEAALADLVANDLLILYQVGKHRYYSLTRWGHWQTISSAKFTSSKHPAPPANEDERLSDGAEAPPATSSQQSPAGSREAMGNADVSQHFPSQVNSSESNLGEGEEKPTTNDAPDNVLSFPTGRRENTTGTTSEHQEKNQPHPPQAPTREVAAILHLSESPALGRIVEDYQHDPLLSLLGEADAAREYIDDHRRNHHAQRMSPAFFRRWLRREHEDAQLRQSPRHTTAATGVRDGTTAALPAPPGRMRPVLPRSLMHLADQDQHPSSPTKGGQKP